jgi:peptidoglycan/xylan/chitin deacetylase (PgdA/CDA1 family)
VNRRKFLKLAAATSSLTAAPTLWARTTKPEIAFTFDDPKLDRGAGLSWQQINERMLGALAQRKIKAALFVCGKRVDSDAGRSLILA